MIRESSVTSMLPPQTITAVCSAFSVVFFWSSAASAVAPAPSASVFSRSSSTRIAEAISSSSTVTISSTYSLDHGKRHIAGAPHRDAIGDRRRRLQRHRMMLLDRRSHRRQPRGLHADHANLGSRFLDGAGNPADQPAAANRHDHSLQAPEPAPAAPARSFPARPSRPGRRRDG